MGKLIEYYAEGGGSSCAGDAPEGEAEPAAAAAAAGEGKAEEVEHGAGEGEEEEEGEESKGLKRLKRDFGAAFKKLTELGFTQFPETYDPNDGATPFKRWFDKKVA